ncbi:MAG: hypothetical protein K0S58_805 [Nitrospira sp.]|jgi:hypothetical protein|nr:hypothetical protein [Nitrospira sp.]
MFCAHFIPHARSLSRRFIVSWAIAITIQAVMAHPAAATETVADDGTLSIHTLKISGVVHTKEETIRHLLPRAVPAEFSRVELDEFERRIRNLSLFDRVSVKAQAGTVTVEVQEKFTLSPVLSFTSGTSVKDLNATAGLVEYNLSGTGTQIGGQFNYSQRGPNVDLWISEHAYQPDRWAKEVKGSYNVNGIRFADSAATWTRNRIGGEFELKGPFAYGSPLRYEVVAKIYRELVQDQTGTGARPSDGYYVGLIPEVTWDRYHWHDLVPSGYRMALELRPGYFLGANKPRHEGRLRYLQGVPLAPMTVLMINSVAEAVNNSGNPNHSLLIGSIAGVRGLSDNLYRTKAQTYMNLELRHAIQVAPRWALQGVLFSDIGAFQPFTEEGREREWIGTVNVGAGIRVIPTFLANTLLRVDFAQLLAPSPNSLIQVGITQYF